MGYVDDYYVNCKRCGENAGSSSYNYRTNEDYFFCTACGTVHNFQLKRDEEGNPILQRDDYIIDGKLGFIKIDDKEQIVEFIPMDQNTTTEDIKAWGKKDSEAYSSIFFGEEGQDPDIHRYIIGIVNEDNTYKQIYGRIEIDDSKEEKILFTEYWLYNETYKEGYGVAKVLGDYGGAFYNITKECTEEDIEELRKIAKETGGYFTRWDEESKKVVVEFGELDIYNEDDYDFDENEGCNCNHGEEGHECKCANGGSCC
jgi:hypothetical protein